ncbi:MAG: Oxygen-independent coproporphyrinogen-III oxidase [Anaerolinea thermophila]|uniref:Heme chaperone HemW n=1 Tax=Anaerolinea thermophila TaxID=167964 RepID=A0A101FZ14_9CHLR|nr:MAG: Oxygen-independent coproporphyrinogen-III oxidase [Anaerolinea thermophila]
MEANPADIQPSKVSLWQAAGINRLSIGMQSARDKELALLGRRHRWLDVQQAVQVAKDAGFTNINLDVMFGLPGQTMRHWQSTVKKVLRLAPTHLSLYALTVEEGTPIARKMTSGQVPMVDEDLAGDMYEWVMEFLPQYGFEQYEISNWAKQDNDVDYCCQHNLLYWRNATYLGLGVAAHSHYGQQRWSNKTDILEYIQTVDEAAAFALPELPCPWGDMFEELSLSEEMNDTAMMGLRLVKEGLRNDLFIQKFGCSLFEVYHDQIEELCNEGLLEVDYDCKGSIHLTRRGCMVGNQVFMRFLSG